MKTVEYTTTILQDGHLFIPKEEKEKNGSTQEFLKLFGTWEDDRDADDIIDDIYETRISSKREAQRIMTENEIEKIE